MNTKHLSKHHLHPLSKNGSSEDWNIKIISIELHQNWHYLFGNLVPFQICDKLRYNFQMPSEKYRITWKKVFGNVLPQDAIKIIKEKWTPNYPEGWLEKWKKRNL